MNVMRVRERERESGFRAVLQRGKAWRVAWRKPSLKVITLSTPSSLFLSAHAEQR